MRYFAPMTDQMTDIMRPINPALSAAPINRMIPQDVYTPTTLLVPGQPQLSGYREMLDVLSAAQFLFGE